MSVKQVHVAVGVVVNAQGEILLARRAAHQHQGNLWEFPGGKVEPGESVVDALARELFEELGIRVDRARPLLRIPHHYPDKSVLLDVWRVDEFRNQPLGREGQPLRWVAPRQLSDYEFPAANRAILTALQLPERLLVTGAFTSPEECLQRVERALCTHKVGGVLLRAHQLDTRQFTACVKPLRALCAAHKALLLLNAPVEQASVADGLHLTTQRLLACRERPVPTGRLLGASCHNRQQLEHALALGVDYVVLSPVLPTQSHPGAPVLGWEGLRSLLQECPVPAFALGGLSDSDLATVKQLGGFGVAAISAWW